MAIPKCDSNVIEMLEPDGSFQREWSQDEIQEAFEDVHADFNASPAGQLLQEPDGIYSYDESWPAIVAAYAKRYSREAYATITLSSRLQTIVQTMHDAGDPGLVLADPPEEAVARPTAAAPVVTAEDSARQEVRDDINGNSVSAQEIEIKRRTRPEYARAYNLERASEIIVGPTETKLSISNVSDELQDFVDRYHSSRSSEHRAVFGAVTLQGKKYSLEQYQNLVSAAVGAGRL